MASKENNTNEQEKGFGIIHQYVKDLSFENLLSPQDMLNAELQPNGEISLSVNTVPVQDNVHEVIIKVKVVAKDVEQEKDVYITELEYGAMVQVEGFDETDTAGILMVETPRLMFPYVRSNMADVTREGGFVPLVMAPVDFLSLYMENMQNEGNA